MEAFRETLFESILNLIDNFTGVKLSTMGVESLTIQSDSKIDFKLDLNKNKKGVVQGQPGEQGLRLPPIIKHIYPTRQTEPQIGFFPSGVFPSGFPRDFTQMQHNDYDKDCFISHLEDFCEYVLNVKFDDYYENTFLTFDEMKFLNDSGYKLDTNFVDFFGHIISFNFDHLEDEETNRVILSLKSKNVSIVCTSFSRRGGVNYETQNVDLKLKNRGTFYFSDYCLSFPYLVDNGLTITEAFIVKATTTFCEGYLY